MDAGRITQNIGFPCLPAQSGITKFRNLVKPTVGKFWGGEKFRAP